MDIKKVVQNVYDKVKGIDDKGNLASYIPELGNVNPDFFGVHISTIDHLNFGVGNSSDKFSIQSIVKVLSLIMAYRLLGEELWNRVKVEPSGTAFNSLIQLEVENGIPRNPFINAGALVIADILISNLRYPKEDFLNFVKKLSNSKEIRYSERIATSEKNVGYRNAALCNLIKSFGNIENNPSEVLDFYFNLCSLEMSCEDLSNLFLFLANDGFTLGDKQQILTRSQTKRINALMQTCGFYDESGEFAFKVGLPGKSGVGGGIVAVHPKQYAIAVWSPKLNEKGNSYKGVRFLEEFTTETELSIF
ncbi:glutaminase [Zobellia galactanivorans]|uniref:Glutaminase n=1 Tax=Zobellia galactanivorans (strain DSM 12802 / CCUG 47099 / CIP 106680 / NCIMB 13871 / Dsij) TaxID=63186 RepID=G0L7W8_ZOBGA|nr:MULTISPECIES: glutaminase [Zobellia]MBU3024964.1 glutaminase [Zobellia galactanivorans]MDO6808740.1 glutaminase [Zobellia galactanivorans]OWW25716.1 glutaminase [Zobellia sp. OII3]CAZ98346.1 Glutaminase [Zobellia galactanivorans]